MADSPIKQGSGLVPLTPGPGAPAGVPAVTGFFDHLDYSGLLPNPCSGGIDCGCGSNCGPNGSSPSRLSALGRAKAPNSTLRITTSQLAAIIASIPQPDRDQIVALANSRSGSLPSVPPHNPILPYEALPDPSGGGDSPCGWVTVDLTPIGGGVLGPWSTDYTPCPPTGGGLNGLGGGVGGVGGLGGLGGLGGGAQAQTGQTGSSSSGSGSGSGGSGNPNQKTLDNINTVLNQILQNIPTNSKLGQALKHLVDLYENKPNVDATTLENLLNVLNEIQIVSKLLVLIPGALDALSVIVSALGAGAITADEALVILTSLSVGIAANPALDLILSILGLLGAGIALIFLFEPIIESLISELSPKIADIMRKIYNFIHNPLARGWPWG